MVGTFAGSDYGRSPNVMSVFLGLTSFSFEVNSEEGDAKVLLWKFLLKYCSRGPILLKCEAGELLKWTNSLTAEQMDFSNANIWLYY